MSQKSQNLRNTSETALTVEPNSLTWKYKCLPLTNISEQAEGEFHSSFLLQSPTCVSGIWKAEHLSCGLQSKYRSVEFDQCGNVQAEMEDTSLCERRNKWLARGERAAEGSVWWNTCLALAQIRTPQSHSLERLQGPQRLKVTPS